MLGGGNPVGGAVAVGTGSTLAYIGDFVYANSGAIDSAGAGNAVTQMEFTTAGDRVIVGDIVLNGSVKQDDQDTGATCSFEIFLNGETILRTKVDTLQEDQPASMVIPILIPPQSKVKITAMCANTVGKTTVNLVGRTYA
jgi:hypothetical protein